MTTPQLIADRIRVARGLDPCDLLLTRVQLVNVLTDEVYEVDGVAIHQGRVVGFGADRPATQTIDLGGQFLSPSFIDGHVHIESSMVTPAEFARAVVPNGTGAVVCDPHEIANVLGADGVRWILSASEGLPLDVWVNVPSCVPATPLETSGAVMDAGIVGQLLESHPRIIGLAEMMNFPGVIHAFDDPLQKLSVAAQQGRRRDGHAPQVRGRDLSAYITAGITTDHEATTADEARDKLRQGMMLQIREGSAAKNLRELIKVVTPRSARRCMFVTDDRHPADLLEDGHINAVVRDAIRCGISPAAACGMASFNTAQHYGLQSGAVAPGFAADLIAFESFDTIKPTHVFKAGKLVAKDGKLLQAVPTFDHSATFNTVRLTADQVATLPLRVDAAAAGTGDLRVIVAEHGSLLTGERRIAPRAVDGAIESDVANDVLKLVVVDRHTGNARTGVGFVSGFDLRAGALGCSVAHDNHNLIAVGVTDADLRHALAELVRMQGGLVAVNAGKVLASFPLDVAGLMSSGTVEAARDAEHAMNAAAGSLGVALPCPFMTLSFLALPPIPALKLTDHGLVDVAAFKVVPLRVG
ncbi:MAG: adenine deaminase [Planctomycetota bacterium]